MSSAPSYCDTKSCPRSSFRKVIRYVSCLDCSGATYSGDAKISNTGGNLIMYSMSFSKLTLSNFRKNESVHIINSSGELTAVGDTSPFDIFKQNSPYELHVLNSQFTTDNPDFRVTVLFNVSHSTFGPIKTTSTHFYADNSIFTGLIHLSGAFVVNLNKVTFNLPSPATDTKLFYFNAVINTRATISDITVNGNINGPLIEREGIGLFARTPHELDVNFSGSLKGMTGVTELVKLDRKSFVEKTHVLVSNVSDLAPMRILTVGENYESTATVDLDLGQNATSNCTQWSSFIGQGTTLICSTPDVHDTPFPLPTVRYQYPAIFWVGLVFGIVMFIIGIAVVILSAIFSNIRKRV